MTDDDEIGDLIRRAAEGEGGALADLFARHRRWLRPMVQLRLDPRLRGRVDPSDVLQETYIELARRLPAYAHKPTVPFHLWIRLIAGERLQRIHRRHLGAAMRDAAREVSIHRRALPRVSSVSLAAHLVGRATPPSQAMARAERQLRLKEALDRMGPIDREIIALRHFEELSNSEAAQVLGLSSAAASNRYVRAMTRLQAIVERMPGLLDRPDA